MDNIDNSHNPIKPNPNESKIKKSNIGQRKGGLTKKENFLTDSQQLIIYSKFQAGQSISSISKDFKVSPQTVHNVIFKKSGKLLSQSELENLQKNLVSLSYANAFQASNSVTQEKIDSSSLVQLGVFSKINIEVARLLQERSTQNIAIHSLSENISQELNNLRDKITNLDNIPYRKGHSPNKQMPKDDEIIDGKVINDDEEKKEKNLSSQDGISSVGGGGELFSDE